MEMKEELMDRLDELSPRLPFNTLDELIHELGGPSKVAEVRIKLLFLSVFAQRWKTDSSSCNMSKQCQANFLSAFGIPTAKFQSNVTWKRRQNADYIFTFSERVGVSEVGSRPDWRRIGTICWGYLITLQSPLWMVVHSAPFLTVVFPCFAPDDRATRTCCWHREWLAEVRAPRWDVHSTWPDKHRRKKPIHARREG